MEKRTVAYRYDGSFEGFLCCVFESYYKPEEPAAIFPEEEPQATLYPECFVLTEPEHACRVWNSFSQKISDEAARFISQGFLSCAPERELLLLRFIRLGYRYGASVMNRLADDVVCELNRAVRALNNEAHLMKEFLRFSEQNHTLAAVITPKNRVLPLMEEHFCSRYPEETFLIYDETHREALVYRPYKSVLVPLSSFELPPAEAEEARFRALWKRYYDSIAVEGRENERCRMGHMPKRFWKNMTEFLTPATPDSEQNFKTIPSQKRLGLSEPPLAVCFDAAAKSKVSTD